MARLKNKVAVVLGASSIEGLGGVIAKTYANENSAYEGIFIDHEG